LDLGTSSSLDSKKPGRDCPKIQKSFEETTRGGFLEVLCGFVEVSSSVSTQFSTFFFRDQQEVIDETTSSHAILADFGNRQ
jgi:hypothetical protein